MLLLFIANILPAQNERTLQPWMQVEGTYNGQKLGLSVGFVGKVNDSTQISVSDVNGIQIYRIKSPSNTTPRFFFTGSNCLLGDFNGDGIKDLVVGGNPTKIYKGLAQGVFDTISFFTKYKDADGENFGYRISIGKLNGDNYADLVIADGGPNNYRGKVYVFFGGTPMDTLPVCTLNGDSAYSFFGWNIAAGDVNNDGYDDVIVRGYDQSQTGPNGTIRFAYIKIFRGGNTIDTIAWKYIKGTDDLGDVASFDVNGDGIDDLLWSNIDYLSTVYIHYGKVTIDSLPNLKLKNPGVGGLGDVIVNGGDLNGDGYNDIVCGAPGNAQDLGALLVYCGGPKIDVNFDAAASLSVQSQFGYSISSVGDISGDGLDDIVVGAPSFQWYEDRGKWFILLGDTNIHVTSVKTNVSSLPSNFQLLQNYPNPFNSSTVISYRLMSRANVTLSIYNILGQKLQDLISNNQDIGEHKIVFDASNFSSGVYYYKLTAVGSNNTIQTETKQMTLIK